jgi:hypothetical protein
MINLFSLNVSIPHVCQFFISVFLGICFLQSGADKLIDYRGNLAWLEGHFSNSILKNIVPTMLHTITFFELTGGALCAVGVLDLLIFGGNKLILYGFVVNAISLNMLFFGQRVSKDYEGAAVLVGYFFLTIVGILTFHWS